MTFVKQELKDYISINVTESYPEYTDSLTVSAYDSVVYKDYIWKAVIDNPPDIPSDVSVNWVKWSVSNKYAAIDEKSHTVTTKNGGDIVMVMQWAAYDSLVLGGVISSGVDIKISDHSDPTFQNPVFTHTEHSDARHCVTGWYQYFNVGRQCPVKSTTADTIDTLIAIPPNIIGFIELTFHQSSISNLTSVGLVLAGMGYYIGCTMFPVGIGIEDFSRYETDEWGTTKLVRRDNRKTRLFKTWVKQIDILRIEDYIATNLLGQSVLVVGDESDHSIFHNMLILGYIQDFDVSMIKDDEQAIEFLVKEMI